MNNEEFTLTTRDGLRLHGINWIPDKPPEAVVCLVHGLGEHSGRYDHVGRALADADMALLGFDLRGHGRSDGKRGHTPSYGHLLDDMRLFLDEAESRFPKAPRFMYGHSLGGTLILLFCLEREPSIHGVIATGTLFHPGFQPPRFKVLAGRLLSRIVPTLEMTNEINPDHLSHDPAVVRAYTSDPLVHNLISVRAGTEMLDTGASILKRGRELTVPLLIMHAADDRLTSMPDSREFAAQVSGDCTLKIWDGLFHEIHNEPEKAQVLDYMIRWIKSRCQVV